MRRKSLKLYVVHARFYSPIIQLATYLSTKLFQRLKSIFINYRFAESYRRIVESLTLHVCAWIRSFAQISRWEKTCLVWKATYSLVRLQELYRKFSHLKIHVLIFGLRPLTAEQRKSKLEYYLVKLQLWYSWTIATFQRLLRA